MRECAFFTLLGIAIVGGSSACGGSSTEAAPYVVAPHFDSLYSRAFRLGQAGSFAWAYRASSLGYVEIPAALGADPTPIDITTVDGVQHWKAIEFEIVDSLSAGYGHGYGFAAYPERNAHTLLVADFGRLGTLSNAVLIVNDTVLVFSSAASGVTFDAAAGRECASPSGLANHDLIRLAPAACRLQQFQTSIDLTFPDSAHIDRALRRLSFPYEGISGVRAVPGPRVP